jgi:hypothetical protein
MKHQHSDINVNVTLPTADIAKLIGQATNAALCIIAAQTTAHIIKSIFSKK